jgi:hypothetical protein
MGVLFFLGMGGLLYYAGDQISAWLWPALPPEVGACLLLGAFLLLSALFSPVTRFLAQACIMAGITTILLLARIVAQGLLALARLVCSSLRTAFTRLGEGSGP